MKKFVCSFASLFLLLSPLSALAEEGIHLDGGAFVDSLQYMLKGLAGIFLVTGIIILAMVILEKATGKKQDKEQ